MKQRLSSVRALTPALGAPGIARFASTGADAQSANAGDWNAKAASFEGDDPRFAGRPRSGSRSSSGSEK